MEAIAIKQNTKSEIVRVSAARSILIVGGTAAAILFAACKNECNLKGQTKEGYTLDENNCEWIANPIDPKPTFRADTIKFAQGNNYFPHHTNATSYEEKAKDLMNYSDTTEANKIVLVPYGSFGSWTQPSAERSIGMLWIPVFGHSDKFEAFGNFEDAKGIHDSTANKIRAFGWLVNGL